MTGRSSKRKGYEAEREISKLLVKWGITEAARTPLSGSLPDYPGDLRIHGFTAEVKRQERTAIWDWWRQVCAAVRGGTRPLLFFRRSMSRWLVVMDAEDWAAMEVELRELRQLRDAALAGFAAQLTEET